MLTPSRLPLAVSSFEVLRRDNLIYIDKTDLIAKMLFTYRTVFFSRPRRFGKSLLVSTLASLFEHGLRDFKGLAIEKIWKDKTYPVCRLDFSYVKGSASESEFKEIFENYLLTQFKSIGFEYDKNSDSSFINQLGKFFENPPCGQFVLLIDEYDAPLTEQLNNEELFDAIRKTMAGFFSRIKGESGALRLLFITGITKYRQVSIFSELNNLQDISLDPQYGELLGYTREEIEKYFPEFLDNALKSLSSQTGNSYTCESLMQEMIANYDGFCFDEQARTHVFAPWSILNFLSAPSNGFKNYWIGSGGVSTWLSEWIKKNGAIQPDQFDEPFECDPDSLGAASTPSEVPAQTLLYQTGYLTIQGRVGDTLKLSYPNIEVKRAMVKLYYNQFVNNQRLSVFDTFRVFDDGNIAGVIDKFNTVFRAVPYDRYPIVNEAGVRGIALSYVMGSGLGCDAERHNANGRSDLGVYATNIHWVFEFKYAKKDTQVPAALEKAITQIKDNHYGEPSSYKKLIRYGVVYSAEKRQIVAWKEVGAA